MEAHITWAFSHCRTIRLADTPCIAHTPKVERRTDDLAAPVCVLALRFDIDPEKSTFDDLLLPSLWWQARLPL